MTPMSRVMCISGVELLGDYLEGQLSPRSPRRSSSTCSGGERCRHCRVLPGDAGDSAQCHEAVLPEDLRASPLGQNGSGE
jgi:hypothetical protein